MANRKNTFLLKRSNVPNKIPPLSGLTTGEVALNTADAKMYTIYTSGDTTPQEVKQIGWDRISRTGDTVTGDFIFNGDLTITSGFTFTSGAVDGYVLTSDAFGNANWEELELPGVSAIYSEINNFTEDVPITIIHNLNTTNVLVQLIDTNTNELIYGFVDNYQLNSIDITLSQSLTDIKVVVAGGTFVELSGSSFNTFTTGVTLNGNVLEFNRNDVSNAYNVDLSPILISGDTFVTGFTYDNSNKLTISQNNNQSDLDVIINEFTGLTINGDLNITGNTILNTLSVNTIGTSGNCVNDIYVSNIQSCSPLNINSNDEGDISFGSSGVTIDLSNNRLGILTDSPTETLDVNGNVRIRNLESGNTFNDVLVVDSDGVIFKKDTTPSYGHFYVTNNSTATPIATTDTYQLVTAVPSLDTQTVDFILNNPADGTGTLLIDPDGDGGFENGATFAANGWTVVNGAQTNQWFVGAPGADTGSNGAYVSDDGGTTNAYSVNSTSIVHFYRDITIPAGTAFLELTFRVRVQGEGTSILYDYLRVNTATTSQTPVAGTLPPGTILQSINLEGANFVTVTINITQAGILTSNDIRLIFSWVNDSSIGTQPPASIDDIELRAFGGACCLKYIGTETKVFYASANLSARSASSAQIANLAIIKNTDASSVKSAMPINLTTANTRYMLSTQDTFELSTNDTITPVIKNESSTNSLVIQAINFVVKEI